MSSSWALVGAGCSNQRQVAPGQVLAEVCALCACACVRTCVCASVCVCVWGGGWCCMVHNYYVAMRCVVVHFFMCACVQSMEDSFGAGVCACLYMGE